MRISSFLTKKFFKSLFFPAHNRGKALPKKYLTNIGEEEMIVILWANESFDKNKPDTHYFEM